MECPWHLTGRVGWFIGKGGVAYPILRLGEALSNCLKRINSLECKIKMVSSNGVRLVFVSHSGEDTWVARQIAREISSCGAQPFLDEADVDVGAEFEEDIREFLDKADELVVLFTPWALERPYCMGRDRCRLDSPHSHNRRAPWFNAQGIPSPAECPGLSQEKRYHSA